MAETSLSSPRPQQGRDKGVDTLGLLNVPQEVKLRAGGEDMAAGGRKGLLSPSTRASLASTVAREEAGGWLSTCSGQEAAGPGFPRAEEEITSLV